MFNFLTYLFLLLVGFALILHCIELLIKTVMTKKRKRHRRFRGECYQDEYFDDREYFYQERSKKRDKKRFKGVSDSPELAKKLISKKRIKVKVCIKNNLNT